MKTGSKMLGEETRPLWKQFFLVIIRAVVVIILCGLALLVILTVTEYKPDDVEPVEIEGEASAEAPAPGDSITFMTWNTGYGGLGDDTDFFMDGGRRVRPEKQPRVYENLEAMLQQVLAEDPDIVLLQEVDQNSTRSYNTNQPHGWRDGLQGYESNYGTNYRTLFVPYPLPPIGRVDAGIMTFSRFDISEAERIQLPCPFSWPVRLANLKRCLVVNRIPLEGTDRELVIVNLHLEAYDDGEGKIAQTHMLRDLLVAEAIAGNYVIAGGDFNQTFSTVDLTNYPTLEGRWAPGTIETDEFVSGREDGAGSSWQFVQDDAVPSCRSLDRPLVGADPTDFQYYVIDGFIVSGNIQIESAETLDLGFVNTDHNPVMMEVTLLPAN